MCAGGAHECCCEYTLRCVWLSLLSHYRAGNTPLHGPTEVPSKSVASHNGHVPEKD